MFDAHNATIEAPMDEEILVSLVVIAYNQERFIREAVQSALSQTYSNLEIILSDDCSTDSTYEIMNTETSGYQGRHKIILNRNQENLGLAGNLNRAFELSSGKFIVAHAGDDISLPERVEKLVRLLQKKEYQVDLVCSYFEEIDVNGLPTGFIKKEVVFVPDISKNVLEWKCGATGACAAYSRKLYEKYGPLNPRVLSEDWVYTFRAWIESGISIVEEPLVKHRTHDASISFMHRNVKKLTGSNNRRSLRRKGAENGLAIAEEWLRAWQISGKKENNHVYSCLQRLVKLRDLQLSSYNSTRTEALKLVMLFYLNGGGTVNAAKLLFRHVLRWN